MSEPPPEARAGRCAICGKPQDPRLKPFCSKRCADIDLGRWLNGRYVIPGRTADEGDQPRGPPDDEDSEISG